MLYHIVKFEDKLLNSNENNESVIDENLCKIIYIL